MTGDKFRETLKWPLFAALIVSLWFGVLSARNARADLVVEPSVSFTQSERNPSDDIRPVWMIIIYEVVDETLIRIIEFVFESYEECQISSSEVKKQLSLQLKPVCYLSWMKEDSANLGSVV